MPLSVTYFLLMAFDVSYFENTVLAQVFFTLAFLSADVNTLVMSFITLWG